jgi:alkyl hydroperoxide reductase subunit F
MDSFLDAEAKAEVAGLLDKLPAPVRLVFFKQKHACSACREQEALLQELAGLSKNTALTVYDTVKGADLARKFGIDKVPATVVMGKEDLGIRFFGLTAGYEYSSLLEAIAMVSSGEHGLKPEVAELARLLDEPVQLEVMVTLTCPYCPGMVHLAHQLAMASPMVRGEMVESSIYPHLVQRYNVTTVPRMVVNGAPAIEGNVPAGSVLLEILKISKPREYEKIEARLREARGERRVREAEPSLVYDVLIVGAGPAAFTAAVYVKRKGLSCALVSGSAGGQANYTAVVENWPGFHSIGGQELAAMFKNHAERYDLHEALGADAVQVEHKEGLFHVLTSAGAVYRGKSVVYAAGKEYRRLGVPGETRFIGKGIAFCATCDAPLFRDKDVAVAGGGNSAFTAARDLLAWAREIHLINITPDFQADMVLQEQIRTAKNVVLHPGATIAAYLGHEKLTGVRLASADGTSLGDLPVEGVFLEIGLVPNTLAVKGLVALNAAGEIVTERDQSTSLPGFFAAGDVTDEPEKQLIVAAAAGAKAALSADRWLKSLSINNFIARDSPVRAHAVRP